MAYNFPLENMLQSYGSRLNRINDVQRDVQEAQNLLRKSTVMNQLNLTKKQQEQSRYLNKIKMLMERRAGQLDLKDLREQTGAIIPSALIGGGISFLSNLYTQQQQKKQYGDFADWLNNLWSS